MDGFTFSSYGARIGIRSTEAASLRRLAQTLPPRSRPWPSPEVDHLYSLVAAEANGNGRGRRFNLLYAGAQRILRSHDMGDVVEALDSDLHFQVAVHARWKLFVHAGVVGWNGAAIVLPGRSGSGKSRLVAELVRAGAVYYSDEFAVLDGHGRVHPYPKRLHIRADPDAAEKGPPVVRKRIEELGGLAGTRALPVGLVVLTSFARVTRPRLRRLSPGEAVLALLNHTVLARHRPQFALRLLARAVDGKPTFRGRRGEAAEFISSALARATSEIPEG